MKEVKLYLIRHGETIANKNQILVSHLNESSSSSSHK
jgi:broad specificity phosphatase PhoE